MKHDVIIIGAGIGGLSCAAFLANSGRRVLVLEKSPHLGGTSYVFWRRGFGFPMGPLSFSFPERVRGWLDDAGVKAPLDFRRNHFALAASGWDIVFSLPLSGLKDDLCRRFPEEGAGIGGFFAELEESVSLSKNIETWHPDYRLGSGPPSEAAASGGRPERLARARELALTPCLDRLRRHLRSEPLIRLLGSQGMSEPEMSMLGLGFMWNVMSDAGIWFPACGINGLNDILAARVAAEGGEVRLSAPVEKILVRRGRAAGVRTEDGAEHEAGWVVSNADAKTTLLGLVEPGTLPEDFRRAVAVTPYTGSELRVYLGVDPRRVDLGKMRATRVGFRALEPSAGQDPAGPEDFSIREIDVCLWSDNAPALVPAGKASIILAAGFSYDHFARFRTGPRTRTGDYAEYKKRLTEKLIEAAGSLLPGLGSAVEVREAATPLTYEDWGHRHRGAIAGWTWSADYEKALGKKLLVETPIPHLLLAGMFAAADLFLGGVPTSMHTARLAADRILGKI
jgi:phytoene dehydrogenase-like protein